MDILFEQVSHVYQPNSPFEFHALKDVSFQIPTGTYVAVIGHTGSGKSTLIQHLNGLITPTYGTIKIGDYVIKKDKKLKDIMKLREQVGMVFQYPEHQLFEESVEKDIRFGPENFQIASDTVDKRLPEVLEAVNLSKSLLNRSPFDLSGGQMRRVAIAGALIMDPKILVLDEPTAGLDPRGQKEIMDMFYRIHKEKNKTTILVTHSMEDALKYADYCIIMDHGQIYMVGKPVDVFKKQVELSEVGLDVPEVIEFLNQFEKRFQIQIPYKGQTLKELAHEMANALKGGTTNE
jgi:energy-coupling factor transport system ATP-binding protein